MKALLVSDLHLTDKPRDEYRWDIFNQLKPFFFSGEAEHLFVLGDITDAKDHHSGKLVNRITQAFYEFADRIEGKVFILRGNHDGLGEQAFFAFMEGFPGIEFIEQPRWLSEEGIIHSETYARECPILLLPHSRNPLEDWKDIDVTDKIVLAHVTVNGALAESMIPLESQIEPDFFRESKITFSGDIHRPQMVGPVTYVGSPYQVRFGDDFTGRALILDTETELISTKILSFPERISFTVEDFEDFERQCRVHGYGTDARKHQIKIRHRITEANLKLWQEDKRKIVAHLEDICGWELCGYELENTINDGLRTPKTLGQQTSLESFLIREGVSKELVQMANQIVETVSQRS